MNRKTLITASAFTGFGLLNAIVFIILLCMNMVSVSTGLIFSILLIFLYFLAVWVPVLLNLIFKINFNLFLVIAYELFVVLALIVGSLWGVYKLNGVYDKIVHLASGVILAMLGCNLFTEAKGNKLTLVWTFIFALSFSMMLGGFWEICEFSFDTFLGENTQRWMGFEGRDVLKDTMSDIICDFSGGIIGGIAAVFFAKNERKTSVPVVRNADLGGMPDIIKLSEN